MAGLTAPMSVMLLDDEYLAGAWSGALTRALAWFCKARLGAEKPPETVSGAPSWSWASVNAPISWLDSREDDQHPAWYLGHESVLTTKSPFGSLTSSRLKVKGATLWGKREDRVGMSGFSRDLRETYDFGQLYEVYVHCYWVSKTESIFASAGKVCTGALEFWTSRYLTSSHHKGAHLPSWTSPANPPTRLGIISWISHGILSST